MPGIDKKPDTFSIRYAIVALIVGAAAGSYFILTSTGRMPHTAASPQGGSGPTQGRDVAGTPPADRPVLPASNPSDARPAAAAGENPRINMATGIAFEASRNGNRFIGYRVLRNDSDARFEVGDIIVAINGNPVEDSAAGGELLLAGLSDATSKVTLKRAQ